MMGILKKMGHCFLFVFCAGKKKEVYLKKKKEETKSGNWDLISFPHRSSFIRFTDVYTHTFMLKSRL